MDVAILLRDINKLSDDVVEVLYHRLSWPDSQSSSSLRHELAKRYNVDEPVSAPASEPVFAPAVEPAVEPAPIDEAQAAEPPLMLALIWTGGELIGWVGTRPWPEKFKGETVMAQTVECFVNPDYRQRGFAKMGLLALISAGCIKREDIVSVYEPSVVSLAQSCGCQQVIYCEPT